MKNFFHKNFRIKLLFFVTLLTTMGCQKIEVGDPNYIKTNTKYNLTNTLSFTIESINDYRCPKDLVCIWSGDVEFHFRINNNFTCTDTLIYLWTHRNNPFSLEGYTWRIEDVSPWPESNVSIEDSDYRIKLMVTKN